MHDKKINLKTPLINYFFEFIVYIILAVIVFILGVSSSIYLSDFTHLGRAGALITLIAISMAYQDFHLDLKNMKFEDAVNTFSKDTLFELWSTSFVKKKKDELEQIKPGFSPADALEVLNNFDDFTEDELNKDGYIKLWLEEMFDSWSKALRELEFKMLMIGTVLWAFSDLINNLFGW